MRESRIEDTSYRDLITIALLGFVVIAVLLITFLNPPTDPTTQSPLNDGLRIEISWPDNMNADVDLWVQGPEGAPVGYSNLGNKILNLRRDDLGFTNDPGFANFEITKSRGFIEGEYIINLHLFGLYDSNLPVPVHLSIYRVKKDVKSQIIYAKTVELTYRGQELTVVRFELTKNGTIVDGSINNVPIKIRSQTRPVGHPTGFNR